MKTVYYTCPFVPRELIAACGLSPMRSVPALQSDLCIEGMCSYAAAWLQGLEQRADCGEEFIAVFSTACDQMRRAFDLYNMQAGRNSFLLNVPSTVSENSFQYYLHELRRLEAFLCALSGDKPNWQKVFAPDELDAQAVCTRYPLPRLRRTLPRDRGRVKILIAGGPLNAVISRSIESLLSERGAQIVFDGSEGAVRPELPRFDVALDDPVEATAKAYFDLPAIWRRPNERYYQWMAQACDAAGADAIILVRHTFCDLWHGQGNELSRRLRLPALELDLDGRDELPLSAVSRIEAFWEALG